MSAGHRPDRPLADYPVAEELPELPPLGAPGEDAAPAPAAAPQARARPEAAVLRFLDPAAISVVVPLAFPFALDDGTEIRSVTLRRLTVAEVGAVIEAIPEGAAYDLYDFLAAMSGLPAPVLRGLIDDDGAEVLERARPLLPRVVAGMFFNPTSSAGAATPPPPPAG